MRQFGALLWFAVIAMLVLFMLGPLAIVVVFSFNSGALVSLPLTGFSLDWYRELFSSDEFWAAFRNSLAVAVPTALLATVTGTMTALALTRRSASASVPLLTALSVPIMIPPLVVAIGLVVLYVRWLSIPLGIGAIIGGHLLLTQPLVALVVSARMASFDRVALEAARDLGATPWQVFRYVTLPQIRAALVGAALLAFAISLDEFIITIFTIGSGNTLSTFVWGKMRTSLDPSINAIATLLLVVTIGSTAIALRMTRYRG